MKYDKTLLDEISIRDKCIIIEPFPEKLNMTARTHFVCECGTEHSKTFYYLNKSRGLCHKHTTLIGTEKRDKTMIKKYGVKNPMHSDDIKNKLKATNLEKYGVEFGLKSKIIQDKVKATNLEKYGVEMPLQSKIIQDKIKETCIKNFGVDNCFKMEEFKQKAKKSLIERYGVDNCAKSEEIKEKKKKTVLERYGVEHYMQNASVADKISKKAYNLKEYKFPCGTIIKVQGYEPWALDELVESGLSYSDIILTRSKVPEIWWVCENGKKHRYYVDIFIPSLNKMIEVKSTWTYTKKIKDIHYKGLECIKRGFNFEIWIYDRNKTKEIINL